MMLIKGVVAAALAGLGLFAVVTADADPAQPRVQGVSYQPNGGLAALLQPLEH